jgi:hypothetical protein
MIHILGGVLFLVFPAICYFHQIAMISVIELRRIAGLADLHGVNFLFISCVESCGLNVAILARFFCYLDGSIS